MAFNGTSSCTVEKPKRSPSKNFCRRDYCAVAVTLARPPGSGGPARAASHGAHSRTEIGHGITPDLRDVARSAAAQDVFRGRYLVAN